MTLWDIVNALHAERRRLEQQIRHIERHQAAEKERECQLGPDVDLRKLEAYWQRVKTEE